ATDLQVERFLTLAVAPHMPRPLQPVVRLLAPVLQKAGWHAAPDGDTELKALQALAVGETTSIDKDRQEGLSRFADAFAEGLRTPLGRRFLDEYERYRRVALARIPAVTAAQDIAGFSRNDLTTASGLLRYVERERMVGHGLHPVFDFTSRFFQYRYVNAHYLL